MTNEKDRRRRGRRRGGRRKVVPIRSIEQVISYDSLMAVQHLQDLIESGDCVGLAFGALLKGGKYAHGYTGATLDQPELTAGILNRLISDLVRQAERNF